ncbi:PREDICTED: uncharacterized protein LOC105146598 isoform X2 [Acromyrmex echinatior]|uniref:uncharacterized protein LOC105146598 isoform X2 n=1 Tax=Acromyrmex echinatior TaxID=103372 RepID=UPI000580B61B|nr:PREDICTED: uncharacterized protein LOC105146598 isoform X2 [Acromyrmex echinatior]
MPFYQYNSFTGKLKPSTNFQPLYPIKSEPIIIYDSIKTKSLTVTPKSDYCTSKPATLDPKLWAKYKHYGEALKKDVPIYLAGGRKDRIVFGAVVAYVGFCTANSFYFIVKEVFFKN